MPYQSRSGSQLAFWSLNFVPGPGDVYRPEVYRENIYVRCHAQAEIGAVLCCAAVLVQIMWEELDRIEATTAAERAARAKLNGSTKQ
jgi:hypothetical protein